MKYKSDLKTTTKVWWRFFWRYAVIFVAVNLFAGLTVNLWGHILPKGLYTVMLLSGVLANVVATLLVMFYCLNRKFKKSDFVDFKPYALMTCDDGHVFDLGGGYQVEVIYTPGHASGGLSFLDVQNRILFTGGMHSDNTFIFGGNTFFPYECTMEAFKDGLETLVEKHLHRFDRIFAGHEIVPLDAGYVTEELQAVKDVLADPGCCEASWQNEAGRTVCRHMVGEAGIRYYLDTSFYRP